jgi:protein-tyrosine phosphatase
MKKILIVCLGNICRSPMAQGILEYKLAQKKKEAYVDSAGTSGWHEGERADSRALQTMKKYGIDISKQRSRPFHKLDFDEFDHIYVMDSSNYTDILAHARTENDKKKVQMILNVAYPEKNLSVPDPYYDDGFDTVYNLLMEACEKIAEEI